MTIREIIDNIYWGVCVTLAYKSTRRDDGILFETEDGEKFTITIRKED